MITSEPYVSIAKRSGAKVLADSHNILPDHPCCVVAASDKFITEHPNETAKILEIHKNATDFINNNTDEAVKMLPKDLLGDGGAEKISMASLPFISGLNDTYKKDVMDFMKLEVDLGILKKPISEDKIFWEGS
jgi:NitT/TauT family transport system substrate-binding protein